MTTTFFNYLIQSPKFEKIQIKVDTIEKDIGVMEGVQNNHTKMLNALVEFQKGVDGYSGYKTRQESLEKAHLDLEQKVAALPSAANVLHVAEKIG